MRAPLLAVSICAFMFARASPMQLEPHVTTFGAHLRRRFGARVRKLSVDVGFDCPNRDGTLGRGGCTFCNVRAFSHSDSGQSLLEQMQAARERLQGAELYLAYFQAYTNTRAQIDTLRQLYLQALAQPQVVGLCVGTRPDCVPDAVLDLLADCQQQGREVWLELGLQSAHDATLQRINRGHDFAAYADTVARAQRRGIAVCTHLILGLPGEGLDAARLTLQRVLDCGVQGLKLHPLLVVRGARLAAAWSRGELEVLTLDSYADWAADLIRRSPRELIYHRVSATAPAALLRAPDWCLRSWPAVNAIAARLAHEGGQGSLYG